MGTRSMLQADNYVNWKVPHGAAHSHMTVTDTYVGLPKSSVPCEAYWLQVQTDAVQMTVDGTDPSGVGFLLPVNMTVYLSKEMAEKALFVRVTTNALLVWQQVAW